MPSVSAAGRTCLQCRKRPSCAPGAAGSCRAHGHPAEPAHGPRRVPLGPCARQRRRPRAHRRAACRRRRRSGASRAASTTPGSSAEALSRRRSSSCPSAPAPCTGWTTTSTMPARPCTSASSPEPAWRSWRPSRAAVVTAHRRGAGRDRVVRARARHQRPRGAGRVVRVAERRRGRAGRGAPPAVRAGRGQGGPSAPGPAGDVGRRLGPRSGSRRGAHARGDAPRSRRRLVRRPPAGNPPGRHRRLQPGSPGRAGHDRRHRPRLQRPRSYGCCSPRRTSRTGSNAARCTPGKRRRSPAGQAGTAWLTGAASGTSAGSPGSRPTVGWSRRQCKVARGNVPSDLPRRTPGCARPSRT